MEETAAWSKSGNESRLVEFKLGGSGRWLYADWFMFGGRSLTNGLVKPPEKRSFYFGQGHGVEHGIPIAFEPKPPKPQQ